jgi:hypothetical protein
MYFISNTIVQLGAPPDDVKQTPSSEPPHTVVGDQNPATGSRFTINQADEMSPSHNTVGSTEPSSLIEFLAEETANNVKRILEAYEELRRNGSPLFQQTPHVKKFYERLSTMQSTLAKFID